ncbi:MAG TPA: ATP synthase F1 subunit delta [Syntrophorhabdaceae bacterium]|nr:ATP synthase F1 subunit delta [Syntrophorhabdaceae bacterium]HNT68992.1 ATP synthase F1 subunit delta [Syntrophorhabdaceae bacterium]
MISQSIAKRYAKGLFAVGERDGKYKSYLEELEGILGVFDREQRLKKALMLPLLEVKRRKELLSDVMRSLGASPSVSSLFNILIENNRMGYLPTIRDVYRELVDEKEGRVRGTIWAAYPLEEASRNRIADVLKDKFNKEVVLETVEDKSLIGGVKVVIKGTIIDGSVKKQIETLKENILKE